MSLDGSVPGAFGEGQKSPVWGMDNERDKNGEDMSERHTREHSSLAIQETPEQDSPQGNRSKNGNNLASRFSESI